MATYYPYRFAVTKNVRAALVPFVGAEVRIFKSGTNIPITLYQDQAGTPGTEIAQPLITDTNGEVSFHIAPGRLRIQAIADGIEVASFEDVVADQDSIIMSVWNEVPAGVKDGNNKDFVLTRIPDPIRIAPYVNGVRYSPSPNNSVPIGLQYSIDGVTVTLGIPPQSSDLLVIDYQPISSV